jgi:hypothetical protein
MPHIMDQKAKVFGIAQVGILTMMLGLRYGIAAMTALAVA